MASEGVDAMGCLPSALNVKVKSHRAVSEKFEARVEAILKAQSFRLSIRSVLCVYTHTSLEQDMLFDMLSIFGNSNKRGSARPNRRVGTCAREWIMLANKTLAAAGRCICLCFVTAAG